MDSMRRGARAGGVSVMPQDTPRGSDRRDFLPTSDKRSRGNLTHHTAESRSNSLFTNETIGTA